ncbi:MAG: hypothetical protein FWC42_11345 [Proteobacteria bacterium]|nr:hypothetical protein [Pseudomonadota bacterium]
MKMWAIVAGLAVLMALAGCATTSGPAMPQENLTPERQADIVKQRSQERWDALIARDYAKVYSYLSPATRAVVSQEQYAYRFSKGGFKKAEIKEVKCENDVCMVRLLLTYDFKNFKDVVAPTGEKWFFRDGQAWFHIPE